MGWGGVRLARMEARHTRRDGTGFSRAEWVRFVTPVVTADEGGCGELVEEPQPRRSRWWIPLHVVLFCTLFVVGSFDAVTATAADRAMFFSCAIELEGRGRGMRSVLARGATALCAYPHCFLSVLDHRPAGARGSTGERPCAHRRVGTRTMPIHTAACERGRPRGHLPHAKNRCSHSGLDNYAQGGTGASTCKEWT